MRHLFISALAGAALLACSSASGPEASEMTEAQDQSVIPMLPTDRPDTTQFADVLAEYRLMNDRLDRVSAPMRLANVDLCPRIFRDPGFTEHALEDYPERLQGIAEEVMGLKPNGIYVRSVRRGSPAEDADIQIGDRIVQLNGQYVPGGQTMKRFYAAISRGAFGGTQTRLTLRTQDGSDYETALRSETACDYPTSVFYSQDVNGHTDGDEVYVTSELMRIVPDDVNLALIIAHEMAHAIAGHINKPPSQDLELEADRMALVLMANAGYDIDAAITYWADAAHPHRDLQDNSESHPTILARYENFKKERARIKEIKARDEQLGFAEIN